MARVYVGKMNWLSYAEDELLSIIIPRGIGNNMPVTAIWQWTVDAKGNKKPNVSVATTQSSANTTSANFTFTDGYYTFTCSVNDATKTTTVTMSNPKGDTSGPMVLHLVEDA